MDIKQHVYKRFALILNDGFLVSIINKIRGSISWGIIKNIPKYIHPPICCSQDNTER